ncbi:MAG: hypothetical protein IKF09_10465 [Clostridiales bacterium]|nr:hypothetical protein [Clostridiales bacterium]
MAKRFKDILTERYNLLSNTLDKLKNEAKSFPEGRVYVKHQENRYYYYLVNGDNEKYINKNNSDTIHALVQKAYVNDVIKASECEMKLIRNILNGYCADAPEELFKNLPEARRKYASPVCFGNRFAYDWANEHYDRSPVTGGYITMKGDKVRSKSEVIIADRLWLNGIPYRYECPLMVNGKIIHPDFTVLRLSDNKLIYHEHCGMADKNDYAENMVTRINDYNKEGIYLGDRLFLSFETSSTPLDVSVIDNLINTHFR